MNNWKTVKLGYVCDVRDGTHDSPKYVDKGFPLITSKNVKENHIDFSTCNLISKEDLDAINKRSLVENGDIIMPMIGTIGNPLIVDADKLFAIKNVALIKFNQNIIYNKYIKYILKSNLFNIYTNKNKRGGTQKFLSLKDIRNFSFSLPSIQVQKQIVSILEKAESLKQKREETNKETQKIIQSIFYDMFGDPVKNEKGWSVEKLADATEVIMGQSPSGNSYNSKKEGIPFFQGKAEFGIKYPSVKKWTTKPTKIALSGDTLISVRAPVGTANMSNIGCCIGRGLSAIRVKNKVNQEFLFRLLELLEKYIASKGTGSTFKAISGKDLKSIEIIVPPIEFQEEFAKRIQLIESIQSKQQSSTKEINTLFDALMQKAFKEELC